jgi:signal transduction histidine kinase
MRALAIRDWRLTGPPLIDAAIALVLLVWGLTDIGDRTVAAVAGAVLMAVPLAWRRQAPLAVTALAGAGFVLPALEPEPAESLAGLLALILACYSGTAYAADRRRAAAAVAVAVTAAVAEPLLLGGEDIAFIVIIASTATGAGWVLRGGRARFRQDVMRLEQERDERAREAVVAERRRVARELHDVVAHAVSVMVVQAGAAEEVLDADPAHARRALGSIQGAGRAAMEDLHRMLEVLRDPGDESPPAPAPDLSRLEPLLDSFREAGLEVAVELRNEPGDLPDGVARSAYRVIQEGLTNVLRHAPGARAHVVLARPPGMLEIQVSNSAPTEPRRADLQGSGSGLAGLAERVEVYGGEFEAGAADGGFVVRARLPVEGTRP